jgi:AcrR family transcriptional regulator
VVDRKQHIVDVSKEMFTEHGISQTTVRQIGARAGVQSGSLYYYFESKADIVDTILADFCETVLAEYRALASRDHPDTDHQLRLMARYGFSLITDHTAALIMIHRDSSDLIREQRFAYLIDFNREVERRYTDVLSKGVSSGEFKSGIDTRLLYRFIRDTMVGAISWYVPGKGATTDQVADYIIDTILTGILSDAESGGPPSS